MIIFDKNWCKFIFKFMFNMGYFFEEKKMILFVIIFREFFVFKDKF